MTRSNRTAKGSGSIKKSRPSGTKANAAGYAKRQSRKEKLVDDIDVYEYKQEKVRRSKVTLELERDEAMEFGGEDEDDEDEPRARLIGADVDGEMIDSGDDEEIDSDAAFEESDEDRFAGFNFSTKGKKKVLTKTKSSIRYPEVDLNEEEDANESQQASEDESMGENDDDAEEEEEGEDDEFFDVLDVLDGRGKLEEDSDEESGAKPSIDAQSSPEAIDEDEDEDAEDGDDDAENDAATVSEDDELMETSPEALDNLQNFISALDPAGKKRKAPTDDTSTAPRKRRLIKERTEAGAENEFRAQSGSKLNLEDLLAPLASQSSTLLSLKKTAKILAPSASTKTKIQTLAAPLPQRIQERLDREAAYDQTKGEVEKWKGTMKRIREAEHLSFPLQAESVTRVSNLQLAAKFKPTTALESSVDKLLKSANLREEDIEDTEDNMLRQSNLTVEEVAQRRGELRKMRELMFRAEVKAKRIGKIKSKTYRRIKRKERERLGEKVDEMGEDGEGGEEERMKREVDRAKERATLRHKNTGKWAKAMGRKEGMGIEGRREIEEMLSRGEKLRRRIAGKGSDDDDSEEEEESGEEVDDGEGGILKIKKGAFEELQRLSQQEDGEDDGPRKSIFDMKFMKEGMAREQQKVDRMADDFAKEMGVNEGSDVEDLADENASGVAVERTGGRVVYRPGLLPGQSISARPVRTMGSDTSSVTLRSTDVFSPPPVPVPTQRRPSPVPNSATDESNPWLAPHNPDAGPTASGSKAPRKQNEIIVSKDSTALDKSKNKLKKKAKKRLEEKEKAQDEAVVEISMDNVLTLDATVSAPYSSVIKAAAAAKRSQDVLEDDADANSEVEEQERLVDLKGKGKVKGVKAFAQRDLVALAFAGDNVVQDFEDAKRREIAADAPREVDTTIPGWGAWGGTGTRRQPTKPHLIKKIAGIDPKSRADFNKSNIIISEKRDKKAAKYLVKDLPYPYTSKAQFERAMDRPLGTEWNTRVGFQRGTLPKVVKKMGTIINPLEKLS